MWGKGNEVHDGGDDVLMQKMQQLWQMCAFHVSESSLYCVSGYILQWLKGWGWDTIITSFSWEKCGALIHLEWLWYWWVMVEQSVSALYDIIAMEFDVNRGQKSRQNGASTKMIHYLTWRENRFYANSKKYHSLLDNIVWCTRNRQIESSHLNSYPLLGQVGNIIRGMPYGISGLVLFNYKFCLLHRIYFFLSSCLVISIQFAIAVEDHFGIPPTSSKVFSLILPLTALS